MDKLSCNQCSMCCKTITLSVSPEEILKGTKFRGDDWNFIKKHFHFISKEEAKFLNSENKIEWEEGYYYYFCDMVDQKTNRCGCYGARPKICSNFPHYWRGKEGEVFDDTYGKRCGFYGAEEYKKKSLNKGHEGQLKEIQNRKKEIEEICA